MKGSALYSKYVIDGILQELTPAEMLDAVMVKPAGDFQDCPEIVVDETVDPELGSYDYDRNAALIYLDEVRSTVRKLPLAFAGGYTRGRIAAALVETMLHPGHFRLSDLVIDVSWSWSDRDMGNMAALYESVRSAGDYIDSLGLQLDSYSLEETAADCAVNFRVSLRADIDEDEPVNLLQESVPDSLVDDAHSWVIYIPFDTSEFNLGGSLLAQALGFGGGAHPQIEDPDYFIDCFEVIHELVEDRILMSAAVVGEGGMISTLKSMTEQGTGVDIKLSDIIRSYQEDNIIRILFAEVPGVIIQVRDMDFDYIDAELLLQDVVYFPLGHPVAGRSGIQVNSSAKTGIQTILESLIQNQSAEGED